jgi:nitrogenase iron protein NifH
MALYAAGNIYSAVKNFEDRSYAKVFGIVLNHRNVEKENEKVEAFAAERGLKIVGEIPRSHDINRYEDMGKTVIEGDISLEVSKKFLDLADLLLESRDRA